MVAWAVPVAMRFPVLIEPELRVAMFPTLAKRVEIVEVIAFKILAASLSVTVSSEAVVEPIVDEPVVRRLVMIDEEA